MADMRHSITIDAPPENVYPLISSAAGLSQWWAEDANENTSSGAVELGFFERTTVYRLRLLVAKPPLNAEWVCESGKEWIGTSLIFHLQPGASGTLLRFTHANWLDESEYFVSCTTTWGELMFRLKAAAEGKSRGPLFLAKSLAY